MRMSRRGGTVTPRTLLGCCGLTLLLACLLIAGLFAIGRQLRQAFPRAAELPPREAFRRAMGRPAPAGGADIRAAGDFGLGGANAWLRFQATPQAISILTRNAPRASTEWLASATSSGTDYDQQRGRILWNEALEVQRPEAYDLTNRVAGTARFMLVDRPSGTAYVYF